MKVLLIVYDNDSYIHFFPQGIAYIAAALKKEGHDVSIYQKDVHHWPESHLTRYLDKVGSDLDMVGLGFVAGYYQYQEALRISRAVNQSKNRKNFIYVLGGHGPSAEPEYFREKMGADYVVKGEGEEIVCDLANIKRSVGRPSKMKLRCGKIKLGKTSEYDPGIYGQYKPISNIDSIPWPAYDLFPIENYRLIRWPTSKRTDFCMPILSGRGCKWHCNFCYRMDEGFRPREPEAVIGEMVYLYRKWRITHFQFSDELFMSSKDRIIQFCEALMYHGYKWDCNGRLNFATPEVLKLMKAAGCQYINYGIEALDDQVLKNMNKGLTVDQIYKGVEATIEAGMTPGLNIIWGNIGDDLETLEKGVDFLLRYNGICELRTIRPVTPYPGSPLYYEAIERGLLGGVEDFYERRHVNSDLLTVNFTDLSDDQFHEALMKANDELISNYYRRSAFQAVTEARHFYQTKDVGFRGFRTI